VNTPKIAYRTNNSIEINVKPKLKPTNTSPVVYTN